MTATAHHPVPFLDAGGFVYSAEVRRLARPAGHLHLRIATRWADARDPQADQQVLGLTLSAQQLQLLVDTLSRGLALAADGPDTPAPNAAS